MTNTSLTIRYAETRDCRFFWEVNNAPAVRKMSLSISEIPWAEHLSWYTRRLVDSKTDLYIAEYDGERVGVVHLGHENSEAILSIAISPEYQGKGLGRRVITKVTQATLASGSTRRVVALVRSDNCKSARAFEAAGYFVTGQDAVSTTVTLIRYETGTTAKEG